MSCFPKARSVRPVPELLTPKAYLFSAKGAAVTSSLGNAPGIRAMANRQSGSRRTIHSGTYLGRINGEPVR